MSKSIDVIYENNLLIVDGLNLAFRWKHSGARDFYKEYLSTAQSFRKSYKAKDMLIVTDMGSSSYRKKIYPEYKADREEKYANQSESEKQIFKLFLEDFNKSLDYIRETTDIPVIGFKGVEADDIAAYISHNYHTKYDYVWLLSTDEDWDLLLKENISRFSYVSKKEFSFDTWNLHYDYQWDQHLSIKCLVGGEDNIKGVSGIGPKRAISLVEKYGNILDIVDAIPIASKYKFVKALNESRDTLLLNYELMNLLEYHREALGSHISEIDDIMEGVLSGQKDN